MDSHGVKWGPQTPPVLGHSRCWLGWGWPGPVFEHLGTTGAGWPSKSFGIPMAQISLTLQILSISALFGICPQTL